MLDNWSTHKKCTSWNHHQECNLYQESPHLATPQPSANILSIIKHAGELTKRLVFYWLSAQHKNHTDCAVCSSFVKHYHCTRNLFAGWSCLCWLTKATANRQLCRDSGETNSLQSLKRITSDRCERFNNCINWSWRLQERVCECCWSPQPKVWTWKPSVTVEQYAHCRRGLEQMYFSTLFDKLRALESVGVSPKTNIRSVDKFQWKIWTRTCSCCTNMRNGSRLNAELTTLQNAITCWKFVGWSTLRYSCRYYI